MKDLGYKQKNQSKDKVNTEGKQEKGETSRDKPNMNKDRKPYGTK